MEQKGFLPKVTQGCTELVEGDFTTQAFPDEMVLKSSRQRSQTPAPPPYHGLALRGGIGRARGALCPAARNPRHADDRQVIDQQIVEDHLHAELLQ